MVAAASGIVLFLIMLVFDWFGYEGETAFGTIEGGSGSAFQWMSFLDIVLLLVCIVAVAMAALRASGSMPALPYPPGLIVAGAGALAVVIVLFRLIVPGDGPAGDLPEGIDATREIGAFLGLIAAGGIAFGGYTALNERASGAAPPAAAPPPPTPPPPTPPPSA
jgi:hypothetical protein